MGNAYKDKVFSESIKSLKETLNLHGEAVNEESMAWGFSSHPYAKRINEEKIEVTTYHFEGEFQHKTLNSEEEIVYYLYSEGSCIDEHGNEIAAWWDPGTWKAIE